MIDREPRLLNKAAPDVHPGLAACGRSRTAASTTTRLGMPRAFTLIELLVAVGIMLVLAGILLPAISHVYNQAQLQAQSMEFQTIASALENYNKDFHAYPSNSSLPTWATLQSTGNPSQQGIGPHFLSLATALLGPGPMATFNNQAGDGADGTGFRATSFTVSTTLGSNANSSTVIVTSVPSNWDPGNTNYDPRVFALTSIALSPGTWMEEDLPVYNVTGSSPSYTLYLGRSSTQTVTPVFTHRTSGDTAPLLKTASGKIWPSYLPNTMKFQYDAAGQPQLLDHWGGIIQYFSRFGPTANNRMVPIVLGGVQTVNSSATPPSSYTPTVGPLYGYCTPKSVEYPYNNNPTFPIGGNTIWDSRDGAVWSQTITANDVSKNYNSWQISAPSGPSAVPFDPHWAFQWMLGDDNFDNFIGPGETLRFDGPYILISAGPTGRLCNFMTLFSSTNTNPTSGTYPTPSQCQNFFTASGNIYNFTR